MRKFWKRKVTEDQIQRLIELSEKGRIHRKLFEHFLSRPLNREIYPVIVKHRKTFREIQERTFRKRFWDDRNIPPDFQLDARPERGEFYYELLPYNTIDWKRLDERQSYNMYDWQKQGFHIKQALEFADDNGLEHATLGELFAFAWAYPDLPDEGCQIVALGSAVLNLKTAPHYKRMILTPYMTRYEDFGSIRGTTSRYMELTFGLDRLYTKSYFLVRVR